MKLKTLILGLLSILGISSVALAQQTGYAQTNLVGNTAGVANHTDAQLSNPWGISFIPGQGFWIANNNGGTSTVYNAQGVKNPLVVTIPTAQMNPCPQGCPTGTVANTDTTVFGHASFIFDTEDGIIASWFGQANAVVSVDNSQNGAVYKGLATLTNNDGTFLLAANFNSGNIDVFDRNFNPTHLAGNFTDPTLPAGYAPHGVHVIAGVVFVLYAQQDVAKHDPVTGAGLGIVDAFDTTGHFTRTFATGGTLNAPWGMVVAPATFGDFASDVLIGNFGDGTINVFDTRANFLGQIKDSAGHVISNPGLWDLVFGAGGTGDPNTLYLTAGGANQTSGLFATLAPAANAGGPDFSINISQPTLTVAAGGTSTLTIGSAAVGGFNSQIALSCAASSGLTCAFNPNTISPGSTTATSVLTVTAAATGGTGGYGGPATMALLPGLGLFGTLFTRRRKLGAGKGKSVLLMAGLAMLVAAMTFTTACGNYSNHQTPTTGQATLTIKGTSGGVTHSVPVLVSVR
jgi:uncharacterized protein (TIGR03118 family)